MAEISTKQFVAALTAEYDLEAMPACEVADEQLWEDTLAGNRLVHVPEDPPEVRGQLVDRNFDFVRLESVLGRDGARVLALVAARVADKRPRERVHLGATMPRGGGNDGRRVDPARQ